MQILEILTENWSLIFVWLSFFLLLTLYFEYKRWNTKWFFKSPTKFLPKREYYYSYNEYLKWWTILLNNPEEVAVSIRDNFVNYLESEKPYLKLKGYISREREKERVLPFLQYIQDSELRNFLLDPEEWIKPHLIRSELSFLNRDKEIVFLRLSALTPIFYELHKKIYEATGNKIGDEWLKLIESTAQIQKRFSQRIWFLLIKYAIMTSLFITLASTVLYYYFTNISIPPIIIILFIVLTLILVSMTSIFQDFIRTYIPIQKASEEKHRFINEPNLRGEN